MARRRHRGGQRGKGTINVSVTLDPSPQAMAARFDHIADKLTDMRPVWALMIPKLRKHMGRVWMSQGVAAGGKWFGWKPSYRKRRSPGAVGVLTGKLLQQVTTKGVLSKTKTTLRFGARGPGVRAFHFGVIGGARPHPYVVATPAVADMFLYAWQDYFVDVMEKWPVKGGGRERAKAMLRRKAA